MDSGAISRDKTVVPISMRDKVNNKHMSGTAEQSVGHRNYIHNCCQITSMVRNISSHGTPSRRLCATPKTQNMTPKISSRRYLCPEKKITYAYAYYGYNSATCTKLDDSASYRSRSRSSHRSNINYN